MNISYLWQSRLLRMLIQVIWCHCLQRVLIVPLFGVKSHRENKNRKIYEALFLVQIKDHILQMNQVNIIEIFPTVIIIIYLRTSFFFFFCSFSFFFLLLLSSFIPQLNCCNKLSVRDYRECSFHVNMVCVFSQVRRTNKFDWWGEFSYKTDMQMCLLDELIFASRGSVS